MCFAEEIFRQDFSVAGDSGVFEARERKKMPEAGPATSKMPKNFTYPQP